MILYQRNDKPWNEGLIFNFMLVNPINHDVVRKVYEIYGTEIYQE